MKKILLVLLLCLVFTGCDMREISDELYVLAIGIDTTETGARLTVLVPEYESRDEYKTEVLRIDAKNVSDGLDRLYSLKSRSVSLLHLKAVVVSEKIAKSGVLGYLAPIKNHFETGNAMGIMICKGEASNVVSAICDNTSGDISSEIEVLLMSEKYNPYCPVVLFDKFYNNIKSEYRSPVAYYADENGIFKGIATFNKDKMVGILDDKDSAYMMIALGEMNGGYIESETSKGVVKLRIYTRKQKIKVNDSVKINVSLIGKLDDSAHIDDVKDEITDDIRKGIKSSVLKAYSGGCDIIGLKGLYAGNFKTISEWQKNSPDFDNLFVSVDLKLSQSVNG